MFDGAAGGEGAGLTIDVLSAWESKLAAELRMKTSKTDILETYQSMLASAASKELNPLQSTAFKVLTSAAVETLLALYPKDTSITAMIDEVTDVHFSVINDLFDNRFKERNEEENL